MRELDGHTRRNVMILRPVEVPEYVFCGVCPAQHRPLLAGGTKNVIRFERHFVVRFDEECLLRSAFQRAGKVSMIERPAASERYQSHPKAPVGVPHPCKGSSAGLGSSLTLERRLHAYEFVPRSEEL